ncbi:MAG: protein phosphatase 2C domain-containing protein [Deltaproteobacteria bacterium]|nr:protein phosphatase 2C domain-containing protein [Deltaproteobacteria bacterium]
MRPLVDISYAAATDVGRKRAHNEDNYLVDRELGLYLVADGMGGHAAGEVASALAVETIRDVLAERLAAAAERLADTSASSERRMQQVMGLLEVAINAASSRIHAEGEKDNRLRGMGTTVSLLFFREGHAFVAHVGDSRIYMQRDGEVKQVTDDHTVARELLRLGMVTPDKLHTVPKKNAITRAVGVYPHVQVDTLSFEVLPEDRFLLCSDGLSGYLDDHDEPLAPRLSQDDGEVLVRELIAFANRHGGKDNITAVFVRLGGGDREDQRRARLIAQKRDVLAKLPLFQRLNERQLLGITAVAEVRSFPAGYEVVREGDEGDAMYVVLDGKLAISKGGAPLGALVSGDQFGEMALIRSNPRSATVTTTEDAELVCLRREDFFDFLRGDPLGAVKLLWQFINVLADRLDRTSLELSEARLELAGDEERTLLFAAPPAPGSPVEDPFAHPRTGPPDALGSFGLGALGPGVEGEAPRGAAAPGALTRRVPEAENLPPPPRRPIEASSFGPPIAERVSALPPPPPLAERITPAPAAPAQDNLRSTLPAHPTPAIPPDSRPDDEAEAMPAHRPTNPGSPDARRRAAERPEPDGWADGASPEPFESHAEPTTLERDPEPAVPTRPKGPLGQTLRSSGVPGPDVEDGPFRPTKQTVRLSEAPEALEELRRQFREKLAAERAAEAAQAAAPAPTAEAAEQGED